MAFLALRILRVLFIMSNVGGERGRLRANWNACWKSDSNLWKKSRGVAPLPCRAFFLVVIHVIISLTGFARYAIPLRTTG
eukprot:9496458-Pyramimonas_sp.AAC.1